MRDCVMVQTTVGSEAEGRLLAGALVEERLAACVQMEPTESVYRWKGAVERAREWRLTVKTAAANREAVVRAIRKKHSYELPEIVVLPVVGGLKTYLEWVVAESKDG